MEIVSLKNLPDKSGRGIVFRERTVANRFMAAMAVIMAVALLYIWRIGGWHFDGFSVAPGMALGGAAVFLLMSIAFLAPIFPENKSTNWLLKVHPGGVLVKYRSYLNHKLPAEDQAVISLENREIEWVMSFKDESLIYLDIKPRDELVPEIEAALEKEKSVRPKKTGGVTSFAHHYPVNIAPPGVIRLDWLGGYSIITPGMDRALKALAANGMEIRGQEGKSG